MVPALYFLLGSFPYPLAEPTGKCGGGDREMSLRVLLALVSLHSDPTTSWRTLTSSVLQLPHQQSQDDKMSIFGDCWEV